MILKCFCFSRYWCSNFRRGTRCWYFVVKRWPIKSWNFDFIWFSRRNCKESTEGFGEYFVAPLFQKKVEYIWLSGFKLLEMSYLNVGCIQTLFRVVTLRKQQIGYLTILKLLFHLIWMLPHQTLHLLPLMLDYLMVEAVSSFYFFTSLLFLNFISA